MSFCPRCGAEGKRVGPLAWLGATFVGAGCLMWVPVVGWVLIPILLVVGVIGAVVAGMREAYTCPGCRHRWVVGGQG